MIFLRPELVVGVLLGGTVGFFFHSLVGTRARTIPICLAVSLMGFAAGIVAALALNLTWPTLGGLPVIPGSLGSILFLLIANRLSLC